MSEQSRRFTDQEVAIILRQASELDEDGGSGPAGGLSISDLEEIAQEVKFARVWGPSAFDGQSVHEHHVLEEGDVVEIHW